MEKLRAEERMEGSGRLWRRDAGWARRGRGCGEEEREGPRAPGAGGGSEREVGGLKEGGKGKGKETPGNELVCSCCRTRPRRSGVPRPKLNQSTFFSSSVSSLWAFFTRSYSALRRSAPRFHPDRDMPHILSELLP